MSGQQRNLHDEGSFAEAGDPLGRALRVQEQAASLNFDWPDPRGALQKLEEEVRELQALLEAGAPPDAASVRAMEDEVGDLLFAAVNIARLCRIRPQSALTAATGKFERRCSELLSRASRLGLDTRSASLEELDVLWESVKHDERIQEARDRPADDAGAGQGDEF